MREASAAAPDTAQEDDMENKKEIILRLKHLLKITSVGRNIEDMILDGMEREVAIVFKDGSTRKVNIIGDSGYAIILDVMMEL